MSGTSGDGLDMAYCIFERGNKWNFKIESAKTVSFPKKLGKKLQKSHLYNGLKLAKLDLEFGLWMGEQVKDFVTTEELQVDAVCSHGHTVFHQPKKGISLQIGNGWALHQAAGVPVINDFRMLDVQLGGQGAPLVPIGDQLLFEDYDYCINLGGIANISMQESGKRIAFDICPFNLLLNYFAQEAGHSYDKDGLLASQGKVLKKMLNQLDGFPYYKIEGAKSLGREDLEDYLDVLTQKKERKPEDILRTLLEHYVSQIKNVLLSEDGIRKTVLITGGGAFNKFFMDLLEESLGDGYLIVAAGETIINFKEALIFGFLGVLRLRNEVNCLASVTGASRDNCGGTIFGL
ncbi:Anhydro-N-acetylmuramic acid kinase [Indibacter alkaliphilus LW1]|uniref:Anhydro-N-acetylmuramic acid kinase n=2 Tax=Indibacter TaxID=647744 RepID=S2CZY2_INDAL|nr:Anhydro-N-acetylmuramic acid kinase [Indibacter alkaliphilus LW1]